MIIGICGLIGSGKDTIADYLVEQHNFQKMSFADKLKDAVARKVPDKEFHNMSDNFLGYMMKNFETELVVMGARIALTTYDLPFQPTKLKNFDEFHQKYGKYILQARS